MAALSLNKTIPFFKQCDDKIVALTPTDDPMVNDLKALL